MQNTITSEIQSSIKQTCEEREASFEIGRCILIIADRIKNNRQLGSVRAKFFGLFSQSVVAKFRLAILVRAVDNEM